MPAKIVREFPIFPEALLRRYFLDQALFVGSFAICFATLGTEVFFAGGGPYRLPVIVYERHTQAARQNIYDAIQTTTQATQQRVQ